MTQNASQVDAAPRARGRWTRVGVVLMAGSLPLWVVLLGVPFLPLSVAARGVVATSIVIVAEVAFWGGAVMAGPEAARRMKSWWRRPVSTTGGRADPESRIATPD
ncbi:MAG TPA: transporter suffix domain-containing protein [Acidobacteria bacterium]|nr:transporter suffix domain-containing protein [Acidobacteriota bacterium]